MKFYRFMPAVATALALSLSACGGDDNGGDDPNPIISDDSIEGTKEFVSATASEFMSKFKAADQEELIKLVNHIEKQYGYLYMPEELDPDNVSYPYRNIARSSQIIDLVNNYNGIYEPGNDKWVKKYDSKDLVFRANDDKYGTIELKVTRSTSKSDVNYQDYDDAYEVIVPNTVTAVLTASGKTMLTEVIETKYNQRGGTLTATETITAANLKCEAYVGASNMQANANTTFTVNGETLVTAKATIHGSNMCDINAINGAVENEDFASILKSGIFHGDIMGKIQVQGDITFSNEVFDAFYADYYYSDPYGSSSSLTQEQASSQCDKAVKTLNNNVSAWVMFNGTPDRQASLTFIKDSWIDEWNGYVSGEYYPAQALMFHDGTTYTDEFFEYGFEAVVNQWERLLNSYELLWR